MAPTSDPSHSFQKLRLDTSTPRKPVASTFASFAPLARKDSPHALSQLTAEFEAAADPKPTTNNRSHGAYSKRAHRPTQQPRGDYGHVGSLAVGSSGSGSGSGSGDDNDDYLARFRQRKTSISFNDEVRLDTGEGVGLGVPVPKSARQAQAHSLRISLKWRKMPIC